MPAKNASNRKATAKKAPAKEAPAGKSSAKKALSETATLGGNHLVITEAVAKAFLADPDAVELDLFTSIEVAAARVLARHKGAMIWLNSCKEISDEALQELAKAKCGLDLYGLTALSDKRARILAQYSGEKLRLWGLKTLSDAAIMTLRKSKANISSPVLWEDDSDDDAGKPSSHEEDEKLENDWSPQELYQNGQVSDCDYEFSSIDELHLSVIEPGHSAEIIIGSAGSSTSSTGHSAAGSQRKKAIAELRAFMPAREVRVVIKCWRGARERGTVRGTWGDRSYRMKYTIEWKRAEFEAAPLTVSDAIELLMSKTLSKLRAADFEGLHAGDLRDGSAEYDEPIWS